MTTSSAARAVVADSRPGERPAITAPPHLRRPDDVERQRARSDVQPWLGLTGLLLVVPVATLLTLACGSLESTLKIMDPITTYALPVILMVSFWWEDWPGSRFRGNVAAMLDVLVIAATAVALTVAGQAVAAGRVDLRGVFLPGASLGHLNTFPATMPLAGAAFVCMLEVTLVGEGWPLRRLGRLRGGVVAFATSWGAATVLYFALVSVSPPPGSGFRTLTGPLAANQFAALLLTIGAWQAFFFVAARGAPFSSIRPRGARLAAAHLTVIGGGAATYALIEAHLGVATDTITASAGAVITASIVWGILLEGWPFADRERQGPLLALGVTIPFAAAILLVLKALSHLGNWSSVTPNDWVTFAGANAISGAVILHVAVTHRWPLRPQDRRSD